MAGSTCGDTTFRIAGVNYPFHGIAVAVTAVEARRAFAAVFWQPGQGFKIGSQVGVLLNRKRLRNRGHWSRQACPRAKVIHLFEQHERVEPCETWNPGLRAQTFFTMTRGAVLGDDLPALRIAVCSLMNGHLCPSNVSGDLKRGLDGVEGLAVRVKAESVIHRVLLGRRRVRPLVTRQK